MWQRFIERARRVMVFAQEEAGRLGQNSVSTEHLLLGLIREDDNRASCVLDKMGVSLACLRSEIEQQVMRGDRLQGQDMPLTPPAMRAMDLAYDEARQLSNDHIGTEHLLLGLIREDEGLAGRVLAKLGVELERTRREVMALQESDTGMPVNQTQGHSMVYTYNLHAYKFDTEYSRLPQEQQAALIGDGLALYKLPVSLQQAIRAMFHASVTGGTFLLDPNALVRVNITHVEGATHYTLTTNASFLANLLVEDCFGRSS